MESPVSEKTVEAQDTVHFVADITPHNIDKDPDSARIFYLLALILELVAFACFVLVLVWTAQHLGGFAWDGSGKMFNYHPVFMVLGMVLLSGNSAIAYRVLREQDKFTVKLIHGFLHLGSFIFTVVGLVAVFEFHNKYKIPNMYSLHSWIGMATVVLFSCQLFLGCAGFLYPKFDDVNRQRYLKVHVIFGGFIFVLSIMACISGITEKMLFGFMKTYSTFPAVGVVANLLGLSLVVFALLVVFIISNPSYKRIDTYEHLN